MAEADYRLMTETMGGRIADALENLMPLQAAPYVATIPTGQWSGSGSDYYITVTAANVTANSILIPQYDKASASLFRGAVWCVPGTGSFTIHTSAIPAGTVSIMVMFAGTMGEAQYQVLADVYSKSQTDALIAQSAARIYKLSGTTGSNTTDRAYINLPSGKDASNTVIIGFTIKNGNNNLWYTGIKEVDRLYIRDNIINVGVNASEYCSQPIYVVLCDI